MSKKQVCNPFCFPHQRLGKNDLTDFEISWTDRRLIKVDFIFSTCLIPWHDFHLNLTNE